MDDLRSLHAQDPYAWSTPRLAERFRISPEAVRRILKSKWRPKPDEDRDLRADAAVVARRQKLADRGEALEFEREIEKRLERGEELVADEERDPRFERVL
jgi:hypothetical protein